MIQIRCPSCDKALRLGENLQGKQIRCPACKNVFRVAAPAAAEEVVPAPGACTRSEAGRQTARAAPPPPMEDENPFADEDIAPPPPPKQATKPRAPAPPVPVDDDPFADEEVAPGPPSRKRRPPPVEDENHYEPAGANDQADRGQARKIARRGAGALTSAFIFALLAAVVAGVIIFGTSSGRGGRQEQVGKAVVIGLMGFYAVQAILVAIGSIMLSGLRGRGMVITACIFCFLLALQLLVYAGFWGVGVLGLLSLGAPFDIVMLPGLVCLTSLGACVMSIIGGIRGLLTLGKPEVRAAMLGRP